MYTEVYMVDKKNNDSENSFFESAPLESIDSIMNTDNWGDNEAVIQNGKKNITRFIFIKLVTILIIGYIILGYKLDIQYYFQDEGVKDFGKVTINSVKTLKMDEFKKYNNTIASISGWVEIENSFSLKLNFKRYNVLKLWRKPIFIVLDKDNKNFIPSEGTTSDISYLKPIKGRLLTYKNMSNGISLLNSYDGIITSYKRATNKQFSKDGVIIIADSFPKQNIWSLIVPSILFLYILYSIFSIIMIFRVVKKDELKNT
jgi:hypothetical protein